MVLLHPGPGLVLPLDSGNGTTPPRPWSGPPAGLWEWYYSTPALVRSSRWSLGMVLLHPGPGLVLPLDSGNGTTPPRPWSGPPATPALVRSSRYPVLMPGPAMQHSHLTTYTAVVIIRYFSYESVVVSAVGFLTRVSLLFIGHHSPAVETNKKH